MKNRPLPIIVVSVLFILTGCIGFTYHIRDFFGSSDPLSEFILIQLLRILAIVCGVFLLFRKNWARWLAIAWMVYHVIISTFNSTSEMITHIVFLIIISFLLFLPASSAYFQNKDKQ